jgi:hypothetical protein
MLNSYRRFKWEKSQRKNSPEFARRRRGNHELAEKRGSPQAMCSRGRRPMAALRKKQRDDEDWRQREWERRRRKFSVRWSDGGALEVESPRKMRKWG